MSDYNLTRIKDLALTATELLADDFIVVDGATGGVRKMSRASLIAAVSGGGASDPLTLQVFMRRDAAAAPAASAPAAAAFNPIEAQIFS